MPTDRTIYKYHFKLGNKIVCAGITNDIDRREAELKRESGWGTGHIKQVGSRTTYGAAIAWKEEQAKTGKPLCPETKSNDNRKITTINEFLKWTRKLEGIRLLYRGLADSEWRLEASGYRRLKQEKDDEVPVAVFQNSITTLLDRADLMGFKERNNRQYSDLELLAELQHHGAATCLIDFTSNPLVALWFACREKKEKNGKVYAMQADDSRIFSEVSPEKLKNSSIRELFKKGKWWKWRPEPQYNRIVAQNSVFIFGKTEIDEKYCEVVEIFWENKDQIFEELKNKYGIEEQYLFSDFTGFSLTNAHDKIYSDYSADDYVYLGLSSQHRGKYEESIMHYSNAIKFYKEKHGNDATISHLYNNRGIAKMSSGDIPGAIEDFGKAIMINPRYADAYSNRGYAKTKIGDFKSAIEDDDKAIEINPNCAHAYYNRGVTKKDLGDFLGCIADNNKAIKINPEYFEAYNNRGEAKRNSGDILGAIADFDKAIQINSQHFETYYNRGIAKSDSGDSSGAIADFDKAIEIDYRHIDSYINRGKEKIIVGDLQSAIEDFDKAIELDPQCADTYCLRGNSKKNLGNISDSIVDYNQAIKINPGHEVAYNNRGVAKINFGDIRGAITDFDKSIEVNPRYADPYNSRGNAKFGTGNFLSAIEDYDKAIEINPKYAYAYYNRANARRKSGDDQGAKEDMDKALKLDPNLGKL